MTQKYFEHADRNVLDRRSFVRGAAIATLGIGMMRTTRDAMAAKATDATLAALSAAQATYEQACEVLAAIQAECAAAEQKLAECETQVFLTTQEIEAMQAQIAQKQLELEAAQDQLAERVSAAYKAGNTEMLEVLLSSSDFDDFITRVYYASKVSDSDAVAIDAVKTLKAELEAQEASLQERKAQEEALLAQQAALTDDLQQKQADYNDYVAACSSEVQSLIQKAAEEKAAAEEAEALAREEEARRQAEAQAQSYASSGSSVSSSGSSASSSGGSSSDYVPSQSGGTGNHAGGVVGVAMGFCGVPYVWGGSSPSGFDCSGLAMYCYACCGYSIPRTTYAQISRIQALGNWRSSMGELCSGDLCFPHSGHVGIYAGGGMWVHAPKPGDVVKYCSVYACMGGGSPV